MAHLWRNVNTGEYIATQYRGILEDDMCIGVTVSSAFTPGGPVNPRNVSSWDDGAPLKDVQTSGTSKVNYNKTKGNWTKIEYTPFYVPRTEEILGYRPEIISYSDDFVPGSSGASYTFVTPAETRTIRVGEPWSSESEALLFNGEWTFYENDKTVGRPSRELGWQYVEKTWDPHPEAKFVLRRVTVAHS